MLNLYNRTIGRIDKGYIFSHYLSVYFVIFILYNFTDPVCKIKLEKQKSHL